MNAADFNEFLVQVETVLDRKFLPLLLGKFHDLGNQVPGIGGIGGEDFLNEDIERVDTV